MRIKTMLFLFLLPCLSVLGQDIPSPQEFLGYELGSEFTLHHKVVDYFQAVDEASSSVQLQQYGETYEGRPLYLAFIGSPENLSRLEDIRMSNLRRTGLEEGSPDSDQPAVVWLSYNVHGNESSSTEASMQTLFQLADPQNENSRQWLEDVIVIMDPCINPDGRDRYVNYFKRYQQSPLSIDGSAMSHQEEWPGGRVNHYLFDLNRDWLWLTQQESRQRLALYNQWFPQIHVDFHEQSPNSPYYFAPGAEPYHEIITPWQREFQKTIGKNHASYFDAKNWLYFTGEVFDLLYPSYGDTYPLFNGAIGMTYEQAGGGGAGLSVKTQYGDTLFLTDRIAHHYTTGLSTVEVASKNKDRLLTEFSTYFSTTSGKYRSYIISGKGQSDKIIRLTDLLDKHRILYGKTTSRKKLTALDYQSEKDVSYTPVSDDLIIPADQPKSRLVQALFEPQTFVADTVTYDITAWSLPFAYGLDAYASEETIDLDLIQLPAVAEYNTPSKAPYGYLVPYTSLSDGLFLGNMLQNKINVSVLHKRTSMSGQSFPAGSLVILKANNEFHPSFDETITKLAREHKKSPVPVYTGLATSGIDLGSGNISRVASGRIALLAGEGTSPNNVGEIWHFFEQELHYPIKLIRSNEVSERVLEEIDVLFLPNGRYNDKKDVLFEFVKGGGKIIAIGSALNLFADAKEFRLQSIEPEEAATDSLGLTNYAMSERNYVTNDIPGAIFRVKMDTTHPLAYGFKGEYETLTRSTYSFILPHGGQIAIFDQNPKPLNGFAGKQALKKIGGRLVLGTERYGSGRVIYFGDNPLFRSFWEQGKLLVINAVFQEN